MTDMTTISGQNPTTAPNTADKLDELNDNCGSDGMDAISQINDLMLKLAEMFKKLRNILQDYNVKQQELGWNVQIASMDDKRAAIDKACESAMWTGALEIAGGVIGMAGVGLSSKFGDAATHMSNAFGKGIEGTGKLVGAGISKEAELDRTIAEFKASNAQSYLKGANELNDKAKQISEQMRALIKDLVDLHGRISSAVHN
ncbi:type III secretion system translocon protein, YopD/IpaC/EspB family [Shewanella psychrophila]|uniref:Type III secretion system translocon protein, YopD/IpaC/EspB family n=1 Tax=Shewanella psychrophila TaxID=225848 RepID=A0A1S6HL11_9GAMM|nr:pathogenicity island effector protein [Shewanella psychrophila]AQS36192.1 type III secretion system translocon protein, YopD/IpaC/EspB family [Shewanella psychrophila]